MDEQFVWRDALDAPYRKRPIGEKPVRIERRLSEVEEVAAAKPASFYWRFTLRQFIGERPERVIGAQAKVYVKAAKCRELPSPYVDAVGNAMITLVVVDG